MTRLKRMKLKRESITIHARLDEAKAEISRIRSEYDYLEPEVLDVLCFPVQQKIDYLRDQLLSNWLERFLLLSEADQDRVIEDIELEAQRLRGECH